MARLAIASAASTSYCTAPRGSGKSELVRALAQDLELDLREACTREEGGSPAVEPRVAILVECDRLVDDGQTVLLFDEIEDVLDAKGPPGPGHLGPSTSRAWLERQLERNRLPTVWTSRDASRIDPALLSRFALVLEIPAPEPEVRRALWAREANASDVLAPSDLDTLATRFATTPAEIARAIATARLAGGGAADASGVSTILESLVRARSVRAELVRPSPASYRPDCVNASADLEALAQRLRGWTPEEPGVAMLLHGLPGTGKSEWVQELGKRLGRPVLARRASDLESKWVGESEQNLARAFEEASARGAILLFDEVDSFLLDRRGATARHELQLTNEFLQQLEVHAGVVACTTNLLERLDPAVLRRFPLKIEFRPLTLVQAAALFESYFGPMLGHHAIAEARAGIPQLLAGVGTLTPGDFAAVARRLRITGELRSAADAVRLLQDEVALKPDAARRVVGFST